MICRCFGVDITPVKHVPNPLSTRDSADAEDSAIGVA